MRERENFFKEQSYNAKKLRKKEKTEQSEQIEEQDANPFENREHKESERSRYRYYFHGSFRQTIDSIEQEGFKIKTSIPNVSTSPLEAMEFSMSQIRKGKESIKARMKHFKKPSEEISEDVSEEDAVLFIIEPTAPYRVFTTNIGRPNVFSTPEQVPADIENKIFYRKGQWQGNQRYIAPQKITQKLGPELNKKRTPDGRWEKVNEKDRIGVSAKLPAESIKMIVKYSPKFSGIFQEIREKMNNGIQIKKNQYIDHLIEYFGKKEDILKDEIEDKRELAENMIRGEMEHYLVSKVRRIFLEIERLKGKELIDVYNELGKDKKMEPPPLSKEELLSEINNLKKINLEDDFLEKYREIHIKKFEKEIDNFAS